MSVKKLDKATLDAWVDGLVAKGDVIGAKQKGDRFAYEKLASASELRLDFDVTLDSPKRFILPPCETLMKFSPDSGYAPVVEDAPVVLMGIHPYDVVAIAQMDAVFEKDNADVHYLNRRKNATIVACDVQAVSPNTFASCMGTATVDEGFDVLLTAVNGDVIVDARTEKGEALMAGVDAPDASADDLAAREKVQAKNRDGMKQHELNCAPDDLPGILENAYDHPIWEEKAENCFSCGSCSLVCPTCYCFDVKDDVEWDLQGAERSRRWDSCMLPGFAVVAGDHNFREKRAARYRHRYYRKGKYLFDRMGHIACVGCGRCITACTANIANPVEIYNAIQEGK